MGKNGKRSVSSFEGLILTRRSLLSSVAASPLLLQPYGLALAQPPVSDDIDKGADLVFLLSDDQKTLRVRRFIAQPVAGNEEVKIYADWVIEAASFGPEAWFDADRCERDTGDFQAAACKSAKTAGDQSRHLTVRKVSWGNHRLDGGKKPIRIEFHFHRLPVGHWMLSVVTSGLSAPGSKGFETRNPVPLYAFLAGETLPYEDLSALRLNHGFREMFGNQLSVNSFARVSLTASIGWLVGNAPKTSPTISAFDSMIRLKQPDPPVGEAAGTKKGQAALLTFGWEKIAAEDEVASQWQFVARADADWETGYSLPSKDGAPAVQITPDAQDGTGAIGYLTISPFLDQESTPRQNGKGTLAVFSYPSAMASASLDEETVFAEMPLVNLSFLRLVGNGSKDNRVFESIVADAGRVHEVTEPAAEGAKSKPATRIEAENHRIATRIGRMNVRRYFAVSNEKLNPAEPTESAKKTNASDNKRQDKEEITTKSELLSKELAAAVLGDRSSVRKRTFFLHRSLADSWRLHRLTADVVLTDLDRALDRTSFSRLTFERSHLRLNFGDGAELEHLATPEAPLPDPDGFVWLGEVDQASPVSDPEIAAIDMGRAVLSAKRHQDLIDLKFRFADLVLAFGPVGSPPILRPARQECRVSVTADGFVTDRRPILAVEFTPQHVMEEAFFQLDPDPLPGLAWPSGEIKGLKDIKDYASFYNLLATEPDAKTRRKYREALQCAFYTQAEESVPKNAKAAFKAVADALQHANLDIDQQIYVGPVGLSSAALVIARQKQRELRATALQVIVNEMLVITAKTGNPEAGKAWTFEDLREAERKSEELQPLYRLWRDGFRVYGVERAANESGGQSRAVVFDEYYNTKRPDLLKPPIDTRIEHISDPQYDAFVKEYTKEFLNSVSGNETTDRLAMARLSGPSLLAFRINCEAVQGDSSEINELDHFPKDSAAHPGAGLLRFGGLPFSFEALTDWSRHEPHVTRRARKLYQPTETGALPPVSSYFASYDDLAILESKGFTRGEKPAEAHLNQVRASLLERPENLETRIELPARLFLSTAQNAVWQSRKFIQVYKDKDGKTDVCYDPPEDQVDGHRSYQQMWTARLLAREVEPGVRAVWSPDLRPEAVGFRQEPKPRLPRIIGAPPRGPWSPWVLRREQVDGVRVSPAAVRLEAERRWDPSQRTPDQGLTDDAACAPAETTEKENDSSLIGETTIPRQPVKMLDRICQIFRIRSLYEDRKELYSFRTSLDAYDRHELVLLSSAYGLPVTGKRREDGELLDEGKPDAIGPQTSQFEPGSDFHITDSQYDHTGKHDLAIYRPKTLDVQDLSLSALGGFLRHDTNFLPPAPALTYDGRAMFDGLSIERWQHEIVMGRDILATVVYAGYLFPFGHKASLVKVTERIFTHVGAYGIKAVLRQRMFIRIPVPLKSYPAVGQPNGGREWNAERVNFLTRETADIVDPTFELAIETNEPSLSGRINLGTNPGLAFWPRTAMTDQANIRFELTIDGVRTEMPLIFVDRIAAKNPDSLLPLVEYYRAQPDTRRTANTGGQSLRFAKPVRDGDTSFATRSIKVSVQGLAESSDNWEGINNRYANNGLLEGADQPPFYPVMEAAEIRIEQVEMMSGSSQSTTTVRFDGDYVRNGFAMNAENTGKDNVVEPRNLSEIFLYVVPDKDEKNSNVTEMAWIYPKLQMGSSGNQSGGVGQPNTIIVGLSRNKGIVGASASDLIYQTTPGSPPAKYPSPQPQGLLSIAKRFSMVPLDPAAASDTAASQNAFSAKEDEYRTIIQSHFDTDAKLLGVITFKKLMDLMKLAGGSNLIPVLQETLSYGSRLLQGVQDGAAEGIQTLQTEILSPLLQMVRRIRAEWAALDKKLNEEQRKLLDSAQAVLSSVTSQSVSQLYPEIDRGLNKLERSLEAAIKTTEPVALLARLAEVHAAGKQFMHELSLLAANPVERLEVVAKTQIANATGDIGEKLNEIQNAAKSLGAALQDYLKKQRDVFVEAIISEVEIRVLTALNHLPWAEIDRVIVAYEKFPEVVDAGKASLAAVVKDTKAEIEKVVKGGFTSALDGKETPQQALVLRADALFKAANDSIDKQIAVHKAKYLGSSGDAREGYGALISAFKLFRLHLGVAEKGLNDWLTNPALATPEWVEIVTTVKRMVALVDLVTRLARNEDPTAAFKVIAEIGRDYLGIDIETKLKALLEQLNVDVVKTIDETFAKELKLAGEQLPTIRDEVLAVCLSRSFVWADILEEAIEGKQLPAHVQGDFDSAETAATNVAGELVSPSIKGFATSVSETFDHDEALRDAIAEVKKFTPLPDEDLTKRSVLKALNDLRSGMVLYRDLFCETIILTAEVKQLTQLSPGANEADPRAYMSAVKRSLARIETTATVLQERLAQIATIFAENHEILLAGAGLLLIEKVLDANQLGKLKDFGDDFQEKIIGHTIVAANFLLHVSGYVLELGKMVADKIAEGGAYAITLIVPAFLNPERNQLVAAVAALKETAALLSGGLIGASIPANSAKTFKELLEVNVLIGTTPYPIKVILQKPSIATDGPLSVVRLNVAAVKTAYQALDNRVRGAFATAGNSAINALEARAQKAIVQPLKVLFGAYEGLIGTRNKVLDELSNEPALGILVAKLWVRPLEIALYPDQPAPDQCKENNFTCDRLFVENELIVGLNKLLDPKDIKVFRSHLTAYSYAVSGDRLAILQIFKNVEDLFTSLRKGDISALVDVAAIRDEIEDRISELIPFKRTLNYDLGFDFDGKKIGDATARIFAPKDPGRFELKMTATIDLLALKADMVATGKLSAFDINLIGDIFDAITLMFDGVDFSFKAGTEPRFDVHYRDFKIGKQIQFVEQLQSYFKPKKGGNGFYMEVMQGKPGVIAGYSLNLGVIMLGSVTFSNVSLNAGASLPFDGSPALFSFGLGRPMAPFTISNFPFGGGGSVTILADAQGFRGVEASMSFGGEAAFAAGPLTAQARIHSGFYIRMIQVDDTPNGTQNLTEIYGTFFVEGSANIWIFDFYASLYVRLQMPLESGGKMEGLAVFTFSFSMGFADFDFQVQVRKQYPALGGAGGTGSIQGARQSEPESDSPDGIDRSIITRSTGKTAAPDVYADTVSMHSIDAYLDYFDLELLSDGGGK